MSKLAKAISAASGTSVSGGTNIEDVFSTYLFDGTGATTNNIVNGVDLSTEGGMVWFKKRDAAQSHELFDTERGLDKSLSTDSTAAEVNEAPNGVASWNTDGFTLDSNDHGWNNSAHTYTSWTFRKASRFFDVVTYTGDGTDGRQITHDLGAVPGMIIVKATTDNTDWPVYHRGVDATAPEDYRMRLNSTAARYYGGAGIEWDGTAPTDTHFTIGSSGDVNGNSHSFVAYLFAHDPLGPSGDGSDGLIACGSYTGTGAAGNAVDVGFEPQWVLIKRSSASSTDWVLTDSMRGMLVGSNCSSVLANLSNAESTTAGEVAPTADGFVVNTTGSDLNTNTETYIYMAIRRGPMAVPESGSDVFAVDNRGNDYGDNPVYDTTFPVDLAIRRNVDSVTFNALSSRLTGATYLRTNASDAEGTSGGSTFDFMDGWYKDQNSDSTQYSWMFKRAPQFFDVVAYEGDGVAGRTVDHNLTVAPEMMIVKDRGASNWIVYHTYMGSDGFGYLNLTNACITSGNTSLWNDTEPTATQFTIGTSSNVNSNGNNYIAILFATCAGVSKVGSYTGNGSNQTIDCDFSAGARFILIKRTDSTGDWYLWDSERGIVAGNDPHLSLNSTSAEVTTDDTIDPDNSGFIVNQVSATNVNVSSASYIYLAIS